MKRDFTKSLKPIDIIYQAICQERHRQDQKWGVKEEADSRLLAVLVEEVGEVAKCLNENEDPTLELIQVAAVAVKWLQLR